MHKCTFLLMFVFARVLQCNAKSCEHAYNTLQRTIHDDRLTAMTDPIQDTALLLYKESPGDTDAIHFAHRLLRTHDNFTSTCYDHHWLDSLAHKLCAAFLRWREWLSQKCSTVYRLGAGTSVKCLCIAIDPLLHACSHHVLPWAKDEIFCSRLHTAACTHAHPFAGLCRLHHPPWVRHSKT
jgi:hypothetical protein